MTDASKATVPLRTITREWTRIGCIGFGGPPTHISLLRRLCVTEREWLTAAEFEDGIAATNLLPGPASTQLAIFCGWRLGGVAGAVIAGVGFIVPGLVLIILLAALFLVGSPPRWVIGAANGAGAAVPAVALAAAVALMGPGWRRSRHHGRWLAYSAVGAVSAVLAGPYLVFVLIGCGLIEVALGRAVRDPGLGRLALVPWLKVTGTTGTTGVAGLAGLAGWGAIAWVGFKIGALSYGGGFVIIPLMQHDAVTGHGWMTDAQFLNAVALGQITPGPVVLTVAVVGYAAAGIPGALLAAFAAFAPSFAFVIAGGPRFDRLRRSPVAQRFLAGAGPTVIGAIAGSAVPLAEALHGPGQYVLLAGAAVWLLVLRRGVVAALLIAAALGAAATLV
jgi:chromate transporter